jgi:hypothetical protein
MATDGNQKELRLAFGVHHGPTDAPAKIVRQLESQAQALEVAIAASGYKLDYIAMRIGKTKSYLSRLQNGRRPIPRKLVSPLCAATGSNLLRQYIDFQAALEGSCAVMRLAEQMRLAA